MIYTLSSEMSRKYELRRRARQVEETRRRIVEATAALHEEVGPARTTVAVIAERAGVSRPTVYNQFPDDGSLFAACGALFAERSPLPALQGLELEEALRALYRYYQENERMLAQVERDAPSLPALAGVLELMGRPIDAAVEEQDERAGARSPAATALLGLAFGFPTWQALARAGLDDAEAARLMARVVACAA
jgi:AcrR family transcriptional regulator